MSNHKNRLAALETAQGIGKKNKYMCVINNGWAAAWDAPEEKAKGYKVQPCMQSAGGTGGEPFYIATHEELEAFAARPDVDLTLIVIGYKAAEPIAQEATQ